MRDSLLIYINHRNDSVARASREAAEWIILRHDLLYSPVLAVASGAFALVVIAYFVTRSVRAGV